MTYAENVTRLLNRERFNLGLHSENTKQEIRNIEKREKENIDNINLAADILIGKPKENWEAGLKDTHPVGGVGLLPYMYGRQIGAERKEADEAFEADRKKHLEKLAVLEAQLKANKNLDTQMHIEKQNMLLNGAYYEDADRFTQLSPHGQTQYAKRKLELFKDAAPLLARNYLAKSEDLLNVNGHEYTPKSVTGIPLYPIALKEHALNVGLDKIMTQRGINVFSPEMLELAGITGPDGVITTTKNEIMEEFRKQHGIDSSYQTRIKAIQEFQNDGEYDFNRLLKIFAGTWDEQGKLMGYGKGMDEALKLLRKEMVYGKLKGDKGWKVLDIIGEQINPITGTPFSEANETRFEQFRLDVLADRNNAARADVSEHETLKLESKDKFLDWLRAEQKKDKNFSMSQQQYEVWSDWLLNKRGFPSLPNWFTDEYFKITKDDKEEIKRIQELMDADLFNESSLLGVNHRVINHFTQPRGGNNTSKVSKYNEAGGGYLNSLLVKGGEYNNKLLHIIREASKQSTLTIGNMKMDPTLWDGYWAMEKDFRVLYDLHLSKVKIPSEAARLAYEDVVIKSGIMYQGKVSPLKKVKGDAWTGNPLLDSEYFNPITATREELYAFGDEVQAAYEWGIKEGTDGEIWSADIFKTTPIPGSQEHLQSALSYYRGEGGVSNYWKALANQFQGISALDLMKWQIQANYPDMTDSDIEALNPQKINNLETACQHPDVTELNRYLNYKSTTAGDAQAKCAVNEYQEMIRDSDGTLTIRPNEAQLAAEAKLAAPRHFEPVIPEGAEYDEKSGSVRSTGNLFQIESEEFWTGNYKPGDTRTIRGETQTFQEDGTWKSANDLVLNEINQKGWVKRGGYEVSDVEQQTKNIPEEIINAYGGGFVGRAKYLAARNRYEKEGLSVETLDAEGTMAEPALIQLGVSPDSRPFKKPFEELTLEEHGTIYNNYWWESKIPENLIKSMFPVEDFNEDDPSSNAPVKPIKPERTPMKGAFGAKGFFSGQKQFTTHAEAMKDYRAELKIYKENLKIYNEQMRIRGRHRKIMIELEKAGIYNPEIHNYIPGSLKGEIFGVPWELPNVPGKGLIIPKEKVSNLQSMSSSPTSPYLDDSLRILSAQLLVASIGQEVPA